MKKQKFLPFKLKKRFKMKKIFIILAIAIILSGVAGALVWEYYGNSLSSGTFDNALYNSSGQYVYLNYTDATNTSYVTQGNYTSTVIDFGVTTGFRNIKWQGQQRACPYGNMSYIDKFGGYCIDQYEAYSISGTMPGSAPGKTPWTSVSQINARTYCANAEKHLCTSEEWLGAANIKGQVYNLPSGASGASIPADGSASTRCVTNSECTPCLTGRADCVSAEGVYDMIGNVAEWVNETVDTVKPCTIGSAGYCYPNSTGGWQTSGDDKYGSDGVYFLANNQTAMAVIRGGYWNDGGDAGLFYALLNNAPSVTRTYIGFRCCR